MSRRKADSKTAATWSQIVRKTVWIINAVEEGKLRELTLDHIRYHAGEVSQVSKKPSALRS